MKQRIFIGVFVMMFIAGLSIHLLVGRRAFNPLFQEVTQRRVQTVAMLAAAIESSPKPKRTMRELEERFGLDIRLAEEAPARFDERGRQFTVDRYEIQAMRTPKAPLLTAVTIKGQPKVLLVRFPVDIEQIKNRRGLDLTIIVIVLMVFAAMISRWAFHPLYKATNAMHEIASGNLEHRVSDNIGPAKDAFNQMADRVASMIEGQQLLLASISHELRTPLARMRLATALLEREVDTSSIDEEIDEMDGLVEMLLLSSQLQSGSFEIQASEIHVQSVVLEVLAAIDLAERYVELALDASVSIQGDRLLLRRVLWNLLSNIAKYTPENCTVLIQSMEVDGMVLLRVADTGPGVSDEALQQLLYPFWRADKSRQKSSAHGGWGVGLSFVQRAIEAHGGMVHLEHNRPSGLAVVLKWPVNLTP